MYTFPFVCLVKAHLSLCVFVCMHARYTCNSLDSGGSLQYAIWKYIVKIMFMCIAYNGNDL